MRDTEFIWCVSEVIEKFENSIKVHYLGWNSYYDEQISLDSPRVANLGFYTMRNNIPMYKFDESKKNKMDSYVSHVLIPNSNGLYKKFKNLSNPELKTCEEYYLYENSKICD